MITLTRLRALVLLGLCLFVTAPAAQAMDQAAKSKMHFDMMDKNKDGAINLEEYKGMMGPDSEAAFKETDANGDAAISLDELTKHEAAHGGHGSHGTHQ
ncbi:EF-hand domain-containing protein [Megalodesulfovibrio paquesii]